MFDAVLRGASAPVVVAIVETSENVLRTRPRTFVYVYDAWNRLIKVRTKESANVTIQTAKFDGLGRRIKKVVTNAGDFDKIEVYFYDGQQIVQINNGSGTMVQQFIHGTQYIDELVMVRVKDKGDLYVHQGERSEREWAATGKASRMRASGPRARPKGASRRRTIAGANWNVIGLTDLGRHVVERYVYTPYGELIVHQDTGFGDRDGDGKVDSSDKGTVGTTCTGTVTGSCRILDLNFDGVYDSTDANLFNSLAQGAMRHPGRPTTNVSQPFAHQGLLFEPELAQYQNRARQHHPGKRRFAQMDPLFVFARIAVPFVDTANLYSYGSASPVQRIDPTGLEVVRCYKANPSSEGAVNACRWAELKGWVILGDRNCITICCDTMSEDDRHYFEPPCCPAPDSCTSCYESQLVLPRTGERSAVPR